MAAKHEPGTDTVPENTSTFDPVKAGRKGGLQRARALGKAKLREGASKAAKARWEGHVRGVARATHVGDLRIGDLRVAMRSA